MQCKFGNCLIWSKYIFILPKKVRSDMNKFSLVHCPTYSQPINKACFLYISMLASQSRWVNSLAELIIANESTLLHAIA